MKDFQQNGFAIENDFYNAKEVDAMIAVIESAVADRPAFRRSNDLFAIRVVLKEIPFLAALLFNQKLKQLTSGQFGQGYFVSKSIYFDNPGNSNWFVAVQPPVELLEKNFTIRIHLDHTDESNGALRVIPASHRAGIRRMEQVNNIHDEVLCNVGQGGIMLMHPLLFHASGKSTGNLSRRVLHIEFSNQALPVGLNWSERFDYQ